MTQTNEQVTPEAEDKSLRVMRSVVINMGVLLVVGTIALFIAIIYKANSSEEKTTKVVQKTIPQQATKEQIVSYNGCHEYKQADIALMGNIISSDNNNGILTITTSNQVIVYDLCNGKIMANFQSVGRN